MAENTPAPQPATASPTEAAPSPPPKKMDKVIFKEEMEIYPDMRLPHLDRGVVKAYEAKGKEGIKAFAMICEKNIVPQFDMAQKYMSLVTPHIPKLIGTGTVFWPLDNREHAVFLYENKLGKSITEGKNPYCLGIKPEIVLNTIFRNLIEAFRAMRDSNFAHGNIRATNIFDGGAEGYENAMLGEMLSTPMGYSQPVLYETIPRGIATPLGRGPGNMSDDLYALGVTLAVLMRVHDPLEGLGPEEIVLKKIEISSFNALVGTDRFPGPVLELLRGLLQDNEELRWNFDDIITWLEGRRVPAKQGSVAISKASRPLEFGRKKFLRPQHLAIELPRESAGAAQSIENNEIYLWLNRSVQNKEYEVRYEDAITNAKKNTAGNAYVDRLASFVSMALAPGYPFMYKELNFFPHGFGNLLVEAVVNKRDLGTFADIIQSEMIGFWGKCAAEIHSGSSEAITRIETCRTMLRQASAGYGIERCIYYLSPMAPCLSDKLTDFYVRTPEDFLRALEMISRSSKKPEWFLDRHIIAFLGVRDKAVIEPFLADVNSTERHRQCHGVIRIFAAIQTRARMEPLPGLTAWIFTFMGAVIDRYHDRLERDRVREALEKIKDKGNLAKMAELLDNFDKLQMDMKMYAAAMRQYQALKTEQLRLHEELMTNKHFGMETGRQTAMAVSGSIAGLVVMIYLFVSLAG